MSTTMVTGEGTTLIDHHHQISVKLENYKQKTMTPQVYSRLLLPNTRDHGYLSNGIGISISISISTIIYYYSSIIIFYHDPENKQN